MATPISSNSRAEATLDQHGHLRESLSAALDCLHHDPTGAEWMLRQFVRLREDIARHFQHEEAGGYFTDVVAAAPRLSATVHELELEHASLLGTLDGLISDLRQDGRRSALEISADFRKFAENFMAHESHENLLIQDAFADEPSSGD